ncbi:hypothetical protein RO3G_15984 [Rhizopus delemar RA 99-880]|uniref:Uncharacterized protein n=1 Tax=Rhizopus delemar (strain RA 99-880 / ATCC MYA-4621 / FGSC 9543 / NRRL 43880) TaxID=246409 RepID=I1CS43_RHIO9|nr:hypothetical protein RO3G_15984 [Rhizopus delemar RA 99-880]|eukprot:EIE91273.1 hypothetical protein RO3G_15984 [Rhizopus delemar RA 99-880]
MIGPILWLSMTAQERSFICWSFGWLPEGKPKLCPRYPSYMLTRSHGINCLDVYRLCLPATIPDPL